VLQDQAGSQDGSYIISVEFSKDVKNVEIEERRREVRDSQRAEPLV